jgi:hypothetical protein
MKKNLSCAIFFLFTITCYTQINFEKAYYINNSDKKIDCYIKNIDWRDNPTDFEYKITLDSATQKGNIATIKEFEILNSSKYIRKNVQIDRSKSNVNKLSKTSTLDSKEEQLFLKVLIEGKATLFSYQDANLRKYFYQTANKLVTQLEHKKYLTLEKQIGENVEFRQQLFLDLKCSSIKMSSLTNLEYKKKSLIKLFSNYNTCSNSAFMNYDQKQQRDKFNITLRPRLNSRSLAINNSSSTTRDTDFGRELGFSFGVEFEYIFPFNKNKWSFSIEPVYASFKSEKTTSSADVSGGTLTTSVNYSSIEIPFTLRHYFFLDNKDSKLFANISYIYGINAKKSSVDFTRADNTQLDSLDELNRTVGSAVGFGYKYKNTYSLEIRYISRNILSEYNLWDTDDHTLSFIFGYSLF